MNVVSGTETLCIITTTVLGHKRTVILYNQRPLNVRRSAIILKPVPKCSWLLLPLIFQGLHGYFAPFRFLHLPKCPDQREIFCRIIMKMCLSSTYGLKHGLSIVFHLTRNLYKLLLGKHFRGKSYKKFRRSETITSRNSRPR